MPQTSNPELTRTPASQVNLQRMMDKLFNRPLAISQDYFQTLMGALAFRMNLQEMNVSGEIISASQLRIKADSFDGRARKSYQVTSDGVAVLPITGSLVHKYGYLQPYSGMTGYDGIRARLHQALNDDDVSSILLDFDSPGGEVAGCFVLAGEMQKMKGSKPVWSMFDELACSAAFAIGSNSDRRIITSTAYAGSVGVITAHVDRSQMLENNGMKVTLLTSGKHKADGNGYEALPDDVREKITGELDSLREEFAQIVASGTKLKKQDVLATEAQVYRGSDAVKIGFADAVSTPAETLAELAEHGRNFKKGKKTIAATKNGKKMDPNTEDDAVIDAKADAATTAADVKARIKGILSHEAAAGRSKLANHLAYDTDMSLEQSVALMEAAAKESGNLSDMMNADHQPLADDETTGADAAAEGNSRVAAAKAAMATKNKKPRKGA